MYAIRGLHFPSASLALRWLLACLLCNLALTAAAQTAAVSSASSFDRFMNTVVGNNSTVGLGSNGTPIATSANNPSGVNLGNTTLSVQNGNLTGSANVKANLPGTAKTADVLASAKIPPSAALGRAAVRLAKSAPLLATGVAIYEVLDDLGITATRVGNSTTFTEEANLSESPRCSVAGAPLLADWCAAAANTTFDVIACYYSSTTPPLCRRQIQRKVAPFDSYVQEAGLSCLNGTLVGSTCVTGTASVALSEQQVIDRIASESGWPSSSKWPEVIKDAFTSPGVVDTPIPVDKPTLTGPSSITKGSVTSVDPVGNTKTSVTTCDLLYPEPGVLSMPSCKTVDSSQVKDGTTTTTTTGTTTSSLEPAKQEDPCASNPDRVGCLDIDTPDGEIPRKTVDITYTPEDPGWGSGQCPAPFSVTTSKGVVSWDLAPYCTVLSNVVRPVVILFALLAAMFIVTGARTEA